MLNAISVSGKNHMKSHDMHYQRILQSNYRSSNSRKHQQMNLGALNRLMTRIPLSEGEFHICLFKEIDNREHLALVMGDVYGKDDVLVRIQSECITGDVFGSLRCDCGDQLKQSIQLISEETAGILIYLRQEGRGIGLAKKLQAYNLQDNGYDTVDANIALGHKPDERDFTIATSILKELGVNSVRIISNNLGKFEQLRRSGVRINSRIPLHPRLTPENACYLKTKVLRMNHIINFNRLSSTSPERETVLRYALRKIRNHKNKNRPFITLSYAQSLDGCISANRNKRIPLSGEESTILTHQIRSIHDAILVGIGTVLTDDPQLTARRVQGRNPQPIILDTKLRFPLAARLLKSSNSPWIMTAKHTSKKKQKALENLGATVFRLPSENNTINLGSFMSKLVEREIKSLMVEGGATVISNFIKTKMANLVISTVTPFFIGGGVKPIETLCGKEDKLFSLRDLKYVQVGRDLIVCGVPHWA